jgi:hypothetical protein
MKRRVARKIAGRTMQAAFVGPGRGHAGGSFAFEVGRAIYRVSTLEASAHVLVRDLLRHFRRTTARLEREKQSRLPYVPPTVTDLGKLGVLFGSCDR